MASINKLLEYLSLYGGRIVCTSSLDPFWIEQARASGRMYVDENSLGFVWEPDLKRIPQTENEVMWFEKWFPLEMELPESLKDTSFLLKKRFNPEDN